MNIGVIAIDLTKDVFSVHGMDSPDKVMLRKTVSRAKYDSRSTR